MQAVGPYRVLGRIGSGGMGDVWLAEDTRLARKVALKTMRPRPGGDAAGRGRLLVEARAVAALNHPRIAAVYDVLETPHAGPDSTLHIVMEYVPGETLSARLRRERPGVDEALAIGAEIAEALAAAHAQGVVHRDLKPANIRLTPDGHVKVLDFGLAIVGVPEEAETAAPSTGARTAGSVSGICGTPGYMSPEQAHAGAVDYRSDLFSLSVVLFEMFCGRRPFAANDEAAAVTTQPSGPPPHARDCNPAVPIEIDALIASGLDANPAARPPSAAAFVKTIGSVRAARQRTQPARRTRRRAAAALAAGVIIIAAAGVASRWRRAPSPLGSGRPTIAVMPLANLSGDQSKDYLGVGIADTLATNLARVSSISVVARGGDGEYGRSADAARVARAVGANLIVEGSVQTVGDRLHVNAKLVRPNGVVAWAGDAESAASDLFALQTRLSSALIDALAVSVTPVERRTATQPPTADRIALDEYWHGVALLDRNDPASRAAAIEALQHAVARDPRFALAHAALGEAYRAKYGETSDRAWIERAVSEVTEALRIDPERADVRLSLAIVYHDTGRSGAAVDELRRVLAEQPANDNAHRLLGQILGEQGRSDEAERELQQAVSLRPQYWHNYESLGQFDLAAGRLRAAVDAFSRRVELRPDDPVGYQLLGAAHQALGDTAAARVNYERAIALQPTSGAYSNLGMVHYSEHRYADAAAAFEAAIKLRPNRALYHRNLGDAYARLDRPDDARTEYRRAMNLAREQLAVNPSDATLESQLAVYEAKVGDTDNALRHADGALLLNPASVDIMYRKAVVLALCQRASDALRTLGDAIARGYSKTLAREDDDFGPLRRSPQFVQLTGGR